MVGIEGTQGNVTGSSYRAEVTEDNKLAIYATGSNGAPVDVTITNGTEDAGVHDNHLKVLGYHEAIGHGVTNGDISIESAMGRETSIGTGAYTILEKFSFIQPGGDTQMYIQSTSAEDAVDGDGAEQITIKYFSLAWGNLKTVQVVPNGTNQITLSVDDIYRIHKMYINKGSPAVGDITLTNEAADVLYGEIAQYDAFMERCIFYIGNGKRITCTEVIFGCSTSGGVIVRLFASEEDDDGNVVTRARMTWEIADDIIYIPLQLSETVENPNNKRIAIGIALKGKVANQTATATLKGYSETI